MVHIVTSLPLVIEQSEHPQSCGADCFRCDLQRIISVSTSQATPLLKSRTLVKLLLYAFSFVILASISSFAQTSTFVEGNVKRTIAWDDLVGSIVEVDGLAWGAFEKGLGPRLVLPHGKVYLRNFNLDNESNGRLLRVAGILRKATVEPARPGEQGYGTRFEYFYIESFAVERIEKIEQDQLLGSKAHWIAPGIASTVADHLIRSRGYQPYGLSLVLPKGAAPPRSFQISEKQVLVYNELDGFVKSVTIINLNGFGKADDEKKSVPAFRLPAKANGIR